MSDADEVSRAATAARPEASPGSPVARGQGVGTDSTRPRWWVYVLIALGVAALAFAIGRFSTFGSGSGTTGPNAADVGFARDMQVHHTQAIQMAMEIYRKTEDDDVRRMAYDIATSQAGQRGEMYDWLVQWGLPQSGTPLMSWMTDAEAGHDGHDATAGEQTDEELQAAMGMATDAEMSQLADSTGLAADCLYLELMIRHHEGAIPMAQAVIELGSVPRVLAVAESIAAGQQAEIDAMQSARLRLGCVQ
jgi:uncharacterized protein (DUF305 family)